MGIDVSLDMVPRLSWTAIVLFKLYDDPEWTYLVYAKTGALNALLPDGEEESDLFDDDDKFAQLHVCWRRRMLPFGPPLSDKEDREALVDKVDPEDRVDG